MQASIAIMDPSARDSIALKIAKLKVLASHDPTLKLAFVPSPSTQGQIQQQTQQTGQPAQQDPNSQAIGASGITLDEVAQMIDQFYQETVGQFGQVQQQVIGIQQQINASADGGKGKGEGGKGGGDSNLEARIAQLEQMLGGTGAVAGAGGPPAAAPPPAGAPAPGGAPQDPAAAMASAPVPAAPTAAPPAAQQGAPQQQMAPMPGA